MAAPTERSAPPRRYDIDDIQVEIVVEEGAARLIGPVRHARGKVYMRVDSAQAMRLSIDLRRAALELARFDEAAE